MRGSPRPDLDFDTVRLLRGKLTAARWHLDRAATLRGEAARDDRRKAQDIYREMERCLAGLRIDPETQNQLQEALSELLTRLQTDGEV